MCFYIHEPSTRKYLKHHGHKEEVKVYKVLKRPNYESKQFKTPCQYKIVKSGVFVAKGKTPKTVLKEGIIYGGAVHVYISKARAEIIWKTKLYPQYVIVECTAKMSDFVAANYESGEAVFKAITIPDLSKYLPKEKKNEISFKGD